jgi:hypothetical protein
MPADLPTTRLCACYVHGLDRRDIDDDHTPFLASLERDCSMVPVDTLPSNELVSTVFTGAYPHEHGTWQVTLKDEVSHSPLDRVLDALPDLLTTSYHCMRYKFDKDYELPAVPRWRRRRFNFHRYKYTRWMHGGDTLRGIGGYDTLFDVLGERCRFQFAKDLTGTKRILDTLPSPGAQVDFVQSYGLDLFEHWNLDRPEQVRQRLSELDGWLADTDAKCRDAGVPMLIFSDHGQQAVTDYIDLPAILHACGVGRDDCTYYIEAQCARFWFHNHDARQRVMERLAAVDHTRLLTREQLADYGLHFEDDSYGEAYLFTDQAWLFFPHDHHQPLANLVSAWTEREVMGRRAFDGRQKGYHGHLGPHPAEEGFLVMTRPGFEVNVDRADLRDIAPTILALAGAEPAPTMSGRAVFTATNSAARAA